ncbi:MAG: hypothetical protein QOF07_2613 [Bradyrhizobium sp.]|jgi:hypothetical protein|nr:hypothetical protein [Bradyrhizobium sp.]
MISEKQKLLCMRFAHGVLSQVEPPEWFVAHLENVAHLEALGAGPDWQGSLEKAGGLKSWETIDGAETFHIYKTPAGGYFIDYADVFQSAAWIFIDQPAEYITFRATILAPLVLLAIKAEQQEASVLKRTGVR